MPALTKEQATEELIEECRKLEPDLKQVRALVGAGGDVNAMAAPNQKIKINALNIPLLFFALGHKPLFDLLVSLNANVQAMSVQGKNALHAAVDRDISVFKVEVIEALLNAGFLANVPMQDRQKKTAVHLAAQRGNANALSILLTTSEGKDVLNQPDSFGNTPLHLALSSKKASLKFIQALLDAGANSAVTDSQGCNALHLAAANASEEVFKHLLERNPELNTQPAPSILRTKHPDDKKTPSQIAQERFTKGNNENSTHKSPSTELNTQPAPSLLQTRHPDDKKPPTQIAQEPGIWKGIRPLRSAQPGELPPLSPVKGSSSEQPGEPPSPGPKHYRTFLEVMKAREQVPHNPTSSDSKLPTTHHHRR